MQETGLEKRMRDLRIFRIFEGTNDILRLFVALTGLQFAGGHLRVLLKKVQNPLANPGVLAQEGTKRAMRLFGVSAGPPVQDFAHPKLSAAAKKTAKSIEDFGVGCEFLLRARTAVGQPLVRYGLRSSHEQSVKIGRRQQS